MAKNLKLNIKNTQLAQALNLGKVKEKVSKKKLEQPAAPPAAGAPVEEEPKRTVKARAKNSAPPPRAIEEEPIEYAGDSFVPTAEETSRLALEEEERKKRIARFLQEEPPVAEEAIPVREEEPPPAVAPPAPPARTFVKPPARLPTRAPFSRSQAPLSSQTPREGSSPNGPRLGPTGRHVKDLIRPKPPTPSRPPRRESDRPIRRDDRPPRRPAVAVPPPAPTSDASRFAKKPDESKRGKAKEFQDLKPLKKQSVKGFDGRDRQGLRAGDDELWRKRRIRGAKSSSMEEALITRPSQLTIHLPISLKDLAVEMKIKSSELIAKLFMQGVVVTLNDLLDDETTVQLLGHEFGCTITIDTKEEERVRVTDKSVQEEILATAPEELVTRAPIITFMGHVDHGKTSLIDAIRSSNRVSQEAGAITQHIGAFRCTTPVGDITVLDTPGHEAFFAMRSRGASVTDIVVLVIAGDEGMKQQTIEALQQAREAKVTIVVALNKCDKPGFNAENVYQQLASHELLPEAWGGSTIVVNCSATTKEGLAQLLEMLALQSEVLELKANPKTRARGTVLESQMHKGMGIVATVLVQNGTLHHSDAVVFGNLYGRIKTMQNEYGENQEEAGPSTPVQITGLSGLPEAGSEFIVVKDEKEAKEISQLRSEGAKRMLAQKKTLSLESLAQQAASLQKKSFRVILKADVQGSLEALRSSLLGIRSDKIEINIVSAGVGEISESDIELAAASGAIIIGFHTAVESHAEAIIKQKGVQIHLFDVIYHAVDEVRKILVDQLDKIAEERELGEAEVLATFKSSHLGVIAGCMVQEGSIVRGQKARLIREGSIIWKGSIASLKRVKDDVKEVKKGLECGILLAGFNEVLPKDRIVCYEVRYLTQEL